MTKGNKKNISKAGGSRAGKQDLSTQQNGLPQEIKKMLTKKSPVGVVFFDEALGELAKVPLAPKKEKQFNITIGEHPLDVYKSPFTLNLAENKHIEKVRPPKSLEDVSYQDFPLGDILSKLCILELASLEQSEILSWFRRSYSAINRSWANSRRRVDVSPKLPAMKRLEERAKISALINEIYFINFLLFIWSGLAKVGKLIGQVSQKTGLALINYWQKDEIIGLTPEALRVRQFLNQLHIDNPNLLNRAEIRKRIFQAVNPPPAKVDLAKDGDFSVARNSDKKIKTVWSNKKLADSRTFSQADSGGFKESWQTFWRGFEFNGLALKPVAVFILVALMVVLPIKIMGYWQNVNDVKGKVLGQAEQALLDLDTAQEKLKGFDMKEAANYLTLANQNFVSAQDQLGEINSFLTNIAEILPINNSYKSGKNLLALGQKLSDAGSHLLKGVSGLSQPGDLSMTNKMKEFKVESQFALTDLRSAQDNLKNIDINDLPANNREKFQQLKDSLPKFVSSLEDVQGMVDFAINFAGDNSLKRYLFIFQNDNELRATGGFMGSFALLDLHSGKIENMSLPKGGTYDVRAGLKELLQPPQPLQLVNGRWEFQDSNWWPDFPTSAKNIQWFYNKSGGPTIDGVVAINSDWLGSLLKITGPIEMPAYNKTIDANNFEMELQKSVEIEYQEKNKPKKILADLAPKIVEKIFQIQPEKFLDLATTISDGLGQKKIQLYLTDDTLQKFVARHNWDGRIKETGPSADYLNVVATNVSGGKTDSVIRQRIYHQTTINSDGSVIDKVLINRYHFGPTDNYFTNLVNNSYLRVYVPKGSKLISASGFSRLDQNEFKKPEDYLQEDPRLKAENQAIVEPSSQTKVYDENDKTVFANWLVVGPGESKDVLLVYQLPFKLDLQQPADKAAISYANYSLLVQSQSGMKQNEINGEVIYPDVLSPKVAYPQLVKAEDDKITFTEQLTADKFYLIGFEKTLK
ncbi:MAG: DUF4012 domain-containing protein [Patescibacteria group bacterium]